MLYPSLTQDPSLTNFSNFSSTKNHVL